MERAIALLRSDRVAGDGLLAGPGSLGRRILLINSLAVLLGFASLFYLDAFRSRLIAERLAQTDHGARIVGSVVVAARPSSRKLVIDAAGSASGDHLRLYDGKGRLTHDTWDKGPRTFTFVDPDTQSRQDRFARWLDAAIDRIVRAEIPPPFVDHGKANARQWRELRCAMDAAIPLQCSSLRLAPDRTPVLTTAVALDTKPRSYLLSVRDARDATALIRAERFRLFGIVGGALLLSLLLSFYLARTIVAPVRTLTRAALRVRAGRDRDVVVPRMADRDDEIGVLARAVADMAEALRTRIDATEGFAADVSHELKNPLASLSSAVETLPKVADPALREDLIRIVHEDVARLDRLITDIAALSRLDAQLSRSTFMPVDLADLLRFMRIERAEREIDPVELRLVTPDQPLVVSGDGERLLRAISNLVDNAVSFSPPDGQVSVTLDTDGNMARITVEDDGPGIPKAKRQRVFERFHSDRPGDHAFGRNSGLGLSIAQTIVAAHGGRIFATDRRDARPGARLVVLLPL